uniref:Uncharacterized protein n=1 Tax=Arundo donax TaxID=35708 RepID=A0A0A9B2J1_ARUDO
MLSVLIYQLDGKYVQIWYAIRCH